jgi:hypothetical protein
VVLDESEYKDRLYTLLESGVFEPLPKDPTARSFLISFEDPHCYPHVEGVLRARNFIKKF